MGTDVGAISGKISLKDDYSKELDKFTKSIENTGKKMQAVGKKLTIGVTAPIVAATAVITKMGAAFDAEMVKINTLVGVSIDKVDAWNSEILKMSTAVGRGPKELAEAMFVVTSAGERGENALKILEASAQAAAVGLGDTTTVARTVTAVMQAYASSGMTASRATDVLTATVREGNLEAASLAGSLGRILGTASQVGITFEEVGSFIATFTRLGVKSEEAVTALRGTVNMLLKPTEQSSEALKSVGMSFEGLREAVVEKGLTRALVDLVGAFKGNETGLARVIPNVRALAGVLGTAGAQAENFVAISDSINQSQGMAIKAFETTQKSITQQFRVISATFKRALTEMGLALIPVIQDKIIPALTDAVTWLSEMAAAFRELPTSAKTAAVAIAGVAAALGPLIFAAGTFLTLLPHMAAGLTIVKGAFASTAIVTSTSVIPNLATMGTTAVTTTASVSKLAIGTAGLKVAAAGLVGIAIGKWLNDLAAGARDGGDAIDKAVEEVGLFKATMSVIPDLVTGYGNTVKNVWSNIGSFIGDVWEGIKMGAASMFESITSMLGPVGSLFEGMFAGIKAGIGGTVDAVQGAIESVAGTIFNANVKAAQGVEQWTDEQRKAFEDFKKGQDLADDAASMFFDTLETGYVPAIKGIGDLDSVTKKTAASIGDADEATKKLNERLDRLIQEAEEAAERMKQVRIEASEMAEIAWQESEAERIAKAQEEAEKRKTDAVIKGLDLIREQSNEVTDVVEKHEELAKSQEEFNKAIQAANQLAQLLGGTFGSVVGQITAAASAMKMLSVAGGGGLSGIFGGLKDTFSKGMEEAGGGIMGVIGGVSAIAGPIAAMAGPVIKAVSSLFSRGGPFGKASIASIVENEMGVGISEGLAKSIEASGQPVQLALAQIFQEGAMSIDSLAQEMGDIFSGLSRGEFTKPEAIAALEQTVPLLIENFGQLGVEGEAQVQRIIAAAQNMGIEFAGLGELISTTLGPSVNEVAETLGLTTQEAKKFAEMLGIKLPTEAQKLAAALGIPAKSVKEIGDALEKEFGMGLEDIQTILDTMGISIEDLAASLGVEIPKSIEAGSKESEELADGTKEVGDNLNHALERANRLADALGRAADESHNIQIPSGGGELPGFQHGGIVDRPTVGLIGEGDGGPEVVAPVKALFGNLGSDIAEKVARAVISQPGPRDSGGGGITISGGVFLGSPEEIAKYLGEAVGIALRENYGGSMTNIYEGMDRTS
jgi:TP901 family phage tail tape measure protein